MGQKKGIRRGNIVVFSALLMVAMMGVIALAVDVGYLYVCRAELQRTADSSAIAATWELIDRDELQELDRDASEVADNARDIAAEFAELNPVLQASPDLATQDVLVGYLEDPFNPDSPLQTDGANFPNAVQVRVRRVEGQNGRVPLFFARVLGHADAALEAQATAAILTNFRGFRTPSSGENLEILPITVDLETWNALLDGIGTDDWCWNNELKQIDPESDGILELNLYPLGSGPAGNRGTLDIGSENNATQDIARQVLYGISEEDLAHHGGSLEFDDNGEIHLNGDTGISAGIKEELEAIRGKKRLVPIFSRVERPGDNAIYTIVQWCGIRIMHVKLTGPMNRKKVIIQPAHLLMRGGIPDPGPQTTHFIYSPVWLAR